jgi:hypothetical protein
LYVYDYENPREKSGTLQWRKIREECLNQNEFMSLLNWLANLFLRKTTEWEEVNMEMLGDEDTEGDVYLENQRTRDRYNKIVTEDLTHAKWIGDLRKFMYISVARNIQMVEVVSDDEED